MRIGKYFRGVGIVERNFLTNQGTRATGTLLVYLNKYSESRFIPRGEVPCVVHRGGNKFKSIHYLSFVGTSAVFVGTTYLCFNNY